MKLKYEDIWKILSSEPQEREKIIDAIRKIESSELALVVIDAASKRGLPMEPIVRILSEEPWVNGDHRFPWIPAIHEVIARISAGTTIVAEESKRTFADKCKQLEFMTL